MEDDSEFEFTPGLIGGICAAGIGIILILLIIVLVGLFLLWRRKREAITLTIEGQQRERFTYQSYYKKTPDTTVSFRFERKRSKKTGSYDPSFEMHKNQNIFLPYPNLAQSDEIPSGVIDPNTVYNDVFDEKIEDDFLNEAATTTQFTFLEPENNVQLLNTTATAFENLDFDDDIDHNDFMPKDNVTDDKKKRISKWSSSSKGVLEITPDPEAL